MRVSGLANDGVESVADDGVEHAEDQIRAVRTRG
jgi:hypothetical protein